MSSRIGTYRTAFHRKGIGMTSTEQLRSTVERVLARSRARSSALTDAVDDADLTAQHSPLMSPLVWDLAHIGNQEELWLVRDVGGREPVRSDIDELYDAFKHSRSSRPSLPLLTPDEARAYVGSVRDKVWDVLSASPLDGRRLERDGFAFGMVAQHEQQHDETMLATHQLRTGPAVLHAPPPPAAQISAAGEVIVDGGVFTMGTTLDPWALDNERPAHSTYVATFALDVAPVTNRQYEEFIADGGYSRPELWSERGWAHRTAEGLVSPQFWERDADGSWWRRAFGVTAPIKPDQPVVHVCFFEAEAYARWAGKRLPTEAEWEKAARFDPATATVRKYPWGDAEPTEVHANLGQRHLEPADVGAYPAGASPLGVQQLMGDVWEWTSSDFEPYPGFEPFPYAEYSEVFLRGDYKVLRGGSFGTDEVACRGTFRNWDHPIRRQIFAGFRCARDV
ncbi:ergothioneine biosynthesis protein EgtB [Rhodococcus sp. 06-156-3C]|nr:ergothioneine biosynthesis protein EgtB [Rhodococcus sp. 06-418-1B]OZD11681.1 ergothioneine biosynthesis protein EgtB [Rhodococcus sp. 06-156-4C]OZD15523.1 ergothioneine biosynthesis protein EgtB [Rhodococcus sp. 06-156-4a]OZD23689.1 ergothioneine biosynthesis protein EgtB [Rhodococcus sp. 06-156-3C]OZD27239.1 ergothioneine biosynthesis protein EgtB [Rhodococcus sp. 06-156-3b]OZD31366.1 ergothioneine biosynthesis protein EgtB [Rhodococcus sp. 06-156-3]OZF65583.1 ergothioneine biosynthesis 